jgi:hypothetical protein
MSNTTTLILVILAMALVGAVVAAVFTRGRSTRLQGKFGSEYDHTVDAMGSTKKAQKHLEDRQKHVKALDIRPLSDGERERYLTEWAAVQSKFIDEPSQAIVDADRLVTEVMQLRAYPVSDFEQRAADISVSYPALVSEYRAARVIALKNENHTANTEELRQATIYYRSLFEELVGADPVAA